MSGTIYTTGNPPTYEEVGAAAINHTHSYAGSDSVGGSANTVKVTTSTSTESEIFYPTYVTNNGNQNVHASGSLRFRTTTGTTETEGEGALVLGTSVSTGTAKNAVGRILLFGTGTKATILQPSNSTSARTITFPNASGTVYTTGNPPTYEETGAAAANHTHSLSIATSSGTNKITLAASTKYQLTAGGSTYIFTTPPDTTYAAASSSTAVGTAAVTGTSTAYARADHVHNITKSTIISALGYTPVQNAGVTSISTGASNGTISVTTNGSSSTVAVKGLGSAAYTSSDDYLGTVL